MTREHKIERKTRETDICLSLKLDGSGKVDIKTPVGFFNHMLEALAKHSGIDLVVDAKGDTEVDDHHTVEDVGICLGICLREALGDLGGIERFGDATVPMDDALTQVTIDLCKRTAFVWHVEIASARVGNFDTELAEEFFNAVANNNPMNLHVNNKYGKNAHHIIESIFKGFARALKQAKAITGDVNVVMSTKGVL